MPCMVAACLQAHEDTSTRAAGPLELTGLLLLCCCSHEPAGMQQTCMAYMVRPDSLAQAAAHAVFQQAHV